MHIHVICVIIKTGSVELGDIVVLSDTEKDDAKTVTALRRALLADGWDAAKVERGIIITPTYIGYDRRQPKAKEVIRFKDKNP